MTFDRHFIIQNKCSYFSGILIIVCFRGISIFVVCTSSVLSKSEKKNTITPEEGWFIHPLNSTVVIKGHTKKHIRHIAPNKNNLNLLTFREYLLHICKWSFYCKKDTYVSICIYYICMYKYMYTYVCIILY